ncbi:hypothetical protein [Mangrovihabitans endophyticus]|uniref:hypothetical protein n=1 Tax=Mangrovihabitans endophyticus TaxID=1751298 RepID=UPI00166B6A11|nr:hypothetical protein [Mangrovihabitans endophyticus]
MADESERLAFERIVENLRRDTSQRRRARLRLVVGVALCLTAAALITFGGIKGAVIAVIPWLIGLVLVVRSRAGH